MIAAAESVSIVFLLGFGVLFAIVGIYFLGIWFLEKIVIIIDKFSKYRDVLFRSDLKSGLLFITLSVIMFYLANWIY